MLLIAVVSVCCCAVGSAQSTIGGVINIYTPVLRISTDACSALLDVEDTTGFRAGDRVMLLQTMGCTGTNDYTVDAVGLFEFATIERVRPGKIIELKRTLVHNYERCNFVQLVRVPSYTGSTTVTSALRGKAWDGRGGGVIALEVKGTLILRNDIDASGIGFYGGATWNGNGQCSTMIANAAVNNPDAAMKGGTFVYPRANNVAGNAELFSAGGGGLGHNSGGGGGGNGGTGGNGGSQWQGCGSPFDNGGRGGTSMPIQFNGLPFLRFGGGGGAGHMNNNNGTAGGSGGGIVVISADTIIGNQRVIFSLGASAKTAGNDGAGGGGAGGTILLNCPMIRGPLHINVNGGNGGEVSDGRLHGPGGGGGGGGVLYSGVALPSGVTFSAEGGLAGRCTAFTDAVKAAHLTKPGSPGSIAFRAIVPENTTPKPVLNVTILSDTTICQNQQVTLTLRTVGSVSKIEWQDSAGTTIGTSSVLDVRPARTTMYVVTISDVTGCAAKDTVTVSVLQNWMAVIRPVDLGNIYCDKVIDTSVVVVNQGDTPGFISNVTFNVASASVVDTLPLRIGVRDSTRVRIRLATGQRSGNNSVNVNATLSPCDSVITSTITWNRQNRLNSIAPKTIIMPDLYSCAGGYRDSIVTCTLRGSSGVVTSIVSEGSIRAQAQLPVSVADGQSIPIALRWSPSASSTRGRFGVVMLYEGCSDTLWVDINGLVFMPRISATDTVSVGDVIICTGQPKEADINLVSVDSTIWIINTIEAPNNVVLDLAKGDSIRGSVQLRMRILPTMTGPFTYLIRIRLTPCDTIIPIVIVGNGIDAKLVHVDTVIFTEPIIGRREELLVTFVNRGAMPIDVIGYEPLSAEPFAFKESVPAIPCALLPNDTLTCTLEIRQKYGAHHDSLVLVTSNPCNQRERVTLLSEAYATTYLYMPEITSAAGANELVPVMMKGRPTIDSTLLDSFSCSISVRAEDLYVRTGFNSRSAWDVRRVDSMLVVQIRGRWQGGDTLATIPMQTLLFASSSTPLLFIREPGFTWVGQTCDVEYQDGSVILNDVCSGRRTRLVSVGQLKPITISPSPARDVFTLTPNPSVLDGDYDVDIIDALGRTVSAFHASGTQRFDCSELTAGMYIVRITTALISYTDYLIIK